MIIGFVFLFLGIWQVWMTVRSFKYVKKAGDARTSPFTMVSMWSSLVMAILFLSLAFNFLTNTF